MAAPVSPSRQNRIAIFCVTAAIMVTLALQSFTALSRSNALQRLEDATADGLAKLTGRENQQDARIDALERRVSAQDARIAALEKRR